MEVDSDGGSANYVFSLNTTDYPNGSHKLTVAVQDNGDSASTESSEPVPDAQTTFGVSTITVNFNNLLSNAKLKYLSLRPDLGQSQIIYGNWSASHYWQVDITADNDTNTVYKSFSGSGTSINVQWDGKDTSGNLVLGQLANYRYYDLGPTTQPPVVPSSPSKIIRGPSAILGYYEIASQGHHPALAEGMGAWIPPSGVSGF